MDWQTVRLKAHDWRGLAGDLVEVPAAVAREMVAEGRAELVGTDRVHDTTGAIMLGEKQPCSAG